MTKKQILFLVVISIFGFTAIFLFGAWRMKPFNSIDENSSVSTLTLQSDENSQNEISSDPNTNHEQQPKTWPTVTPRIVSDNTPTPFRLDFKQIVLADSETQNTPKETQTPSVEQNASTPTQEPSPTQPKDILSSSYEPEFQSPFSIGKSVQGEDLWMYRFGNGATEKLIVAGIHGGYEYNTTDLAHELIIFINENPEIIPEDITLYILPSLNPDGLIRSLGYAGRANANNVDLNRNWDFNWKSTWDPNGCWAYLPIYGGDNPFSEPETAALRDFIHSHNLSAILSYHSAALGVFPGGAPDTNLSVALAKAVAKVVPYPYPPIQTGCEITGQFVDYAASYGIPALDIELMNHKDSDFEINLEVLKVFLAWTH